MRLLTLIALGALCAACGGDRPDSPGTPDAPKAAEFLPFVEGTRRTIDVKVGSGSLLIETRIEGEDVRSLPGEGQVPFGFVYGRPKGMSHDGTKSIYALPGGVPRESYFDGFVFRLHHDPPIPLLPDRVAPGETLRWEGLLECGGAEGRTTASLHVDGFEEIEVPAGTFRAVRVRTIYVSPELTVTRWFAKGVGLVRMEVGGSPDPVTVVLVSHRTRLPGKRR